MKRTISVLTAALCLVIMTSTATAAMQLEERDMRYVKEFRKQMQRDCSKAFSGELSADEQEAQIKKCVALYEGTTNEYNKVFRRECPKGSREDPTCISWDYLLKQGRN